MHYYEVSPLKIVHARQSLLTYESDRELSAGHLVSVEVGKSLVPAIVLAEAPKPAFATKPIGSLIEPHRLPSHLLTLHKWMSEYYFTHPVNVWQTILPRGIMKNRRTSQKTTAHLERERTNFVLNKAQQSIVDHTLGRPGRTTLLHGITGSGKTAVYIELIKQTLAQGKSAILLVPEISLTSQLVAECLPHFPDLILTHSTMTEAARHSAWKSCLDSTTPRLVIGPRSALFMPLENIGLIIIDECHEPSLKQDQAPRYSALRAAAVIARQTNAHLLLGSATPSVSDYYLASHDPQAIVHMRESARRDTVKPRTTVIDMTKRDYFGRNRYLSSPLLLAMEKALQDKKQILLFHNRRGSASSTLCEHCGWSAACPHCVIPLTLHADQFELRCHVCSHKEKVPTSCPDCHQPGIIHKGIGTKRIAEEVARIFPHATVARFDGDTENTDTLEKRYQELYDGDIDIIIGTQVVAKGLDLPKLRVVGVVQADSGLALPDYYSEERTFQLLAQVVGRVGRSHHETDLIVQSYQPTHPSVQYGLAQNYDAFYEYCLAERKRGNFPPFTHLLKLQCSYKTEASAVRAARSLAETLRAHLPPDVILFGPTPAFYERARDTYRWQLLLKSPTRAQLIETLEHLPATHWQYELDPLSLL